MSFAGEFLDMLSFGKKKKKSSKTKQGPHSRSSSISTVPVTSGASVLSSTVTVQDSDANINVTKAQIDVEPAKDVAKKSARWEECHGTALAAVGHLRMIRESTEHISSLKATREILDDLLKMTQVLGQDTDIYVPLRTRVDKYKKYFEDEVRIMEEEDAAPDPDSPLARLVQLYARELENVLAALIKDCAPNDSGTNRLYEEIKASLGRGSTLNLEARTIDQLMNDLTTAFKQLRAGIQVYMGREAAFQSQRLFDAEVVPLQTNEPFMKTKSAAITSGGGQHGTCLRGTRREILGEIEDWGQSETECRVFCIADMAGTGKSTIANHMAQKWKKERRLVARFFFSKGNTGTTTGKDLCIWMAQELSINHPMLGEELKKTLENKETIASLPLQTQWEELVSNHALRLETEGGPYFFVVDALDECIDSERQTLLTSLLRTIDAIAPSDPNLRLLLTTRPEADIITVLDEEGSSVASRRRILRRLDGGDVNLDDISLYVHQQLKRIDLSLISLEQREQFIKRSEGLFIFASTACSLLVQSYDPRVVLRHIMSSRDASLDGLYQEVLRTAIPDDGSSLKLVQQVLAVILAAHHPLSMETLSRFLGYNGNLSAQQVVQRLGSVLASGGPDEAVYILHPTFREFLLYQGRSELYAINIRVGHRLLAIACLEQLISELKQDICRIKKPGKPRPHRREDVDVDLQVREYMSKALRYSTTWWTDHASHALQHSIVRELMLKFFTVKLLDWLEVVDLFQETMEAAQSAIHLQERLRRYGLLEEDVQSSEGHTPLFEWLDDIVHFIDEFRPLWTTKSLAPYRTALMYWEHPGPIYNHYASKQSGDRPVVRLSVKEEKGFFPSLIFYGHSDEVRDIVFSPDSQHIASSSKDGTVRIWNVSSGLQEAEYRLPVVQSLAYLSSGKGLIATTLDSLIYYLNLDDESSSPREISTDATFTQSCVCVSTKDDFLLCGTDCGELITIDPHANTVLGRFQAHTATIDSVSISTDGTIFASSSKDGTIAIWNGDSSLLTQQPLRVFSCEETCRKAHIMLLSSRSRTLIASCSELRLWNIDSDEIVAYPDDLRRDWPRALSSDGKYLMTASNQMLWLHDGQTGRPISKFEYMPVKGSYVSAFSKDNRFLAITGDRNIYAWPLQDITPLGEGGFFSYEELPCWAFPCDQRKVAQIVKFKDGNGHQQEKLTIWNLMEARMLASFQGVKEHWTIAICFSPSGRFLVCASRNSIELRDGFSGEPIGSEVALLEAQFVHCIVVSPCETIVAMARGVSRDADSSSKSIWKEVIFWSVENQSQLIPMSKIELDLQYDPWIEGQPLAAFDSHSHLFRILDKIWDISKLPPSNLSEEENDAQLQDWPVPPWRVRYTAVHGLLFGQPSFEYYETPRLWGFSGVHIDGELAVCYNETGSFIVLDFSHMEVPVRSQEIMDEVEKEEEREYFHAWKNLECIIA